MSAGGGPGGGEDGLTGAGDPSPARRLFSRGVMLLIAVVSLYIVAPSLVEVFSSWDQLRDLEPVWLFVVAAAQALSFASLWGLQRVALRTRRWLPIITSQLAGNTAARLIPGGPAAGTAVQFQLLRTAGIGTARATSGLTAVGLLQLGTTFALPLIALPGVLLGAPVPRDLLSAAWLGAALFVVLFIVVVAALRFDRPLRQLGRFVDSARRHIPSIDPADRPTSTSLLRERDALIDGLDGHWIRAALFAVSRAAFDFLSLMLAMAAFGLEARPSLVLLAYASSALLTLVPLTPGGLGFVEAGLTGTLTLAGISASEAVAVTLLYRLFSFWLPIPVGMLAGVIHRVRFGQTAKIDP